MGKKDYLDFSESKNWNVAEGYSQAKILKWLVLADDYEVVATFGTNEMMDEYQVSERLKSDARVKALRRLIKTLKMIINNSYFAVKKKDKPDLEKFMKDLVDIEKIMPVAYENIINQKTKTREVLIDEDRFQSILDMVIKIKEGINEPLNKADLIYSSTEEIDPDELKRRLMEDIIHSG